jgi:hypothetical protein
VLSEQLTKNKQLATSQAVTQGASIKQTVRCLTCREIIEERVDGVLTKERRCRCQGEAE